MTNKYKSLLSKIFIYAICISVLPILAFTTVSIRFNNPLELIFWVIIGVLVELKPIAVIRYGQRREITMVSIVQISAIMLLGTEKATWISVLAVLVVELILKKPYSKVFFNAGQYGISLLVSGYLFYELKISPPNIVIDILKDFPALMISVFTFHIMNIFLVILVISLTSGTSFKYLFIDSLRIDVLYYITLVPQSIAMALMYNPQFPFVILVMFPPMLATDKALRRYYNFQAETRETLKVLADTIDARDKYTSLHSVRVAEYAAKIAQKLGLSPDVVDEIEMAGRIHDLGKIAIPDSILKKEGRLDNEEYNQIKQHPETGFNLIKNLKPFMNSAEYVLYHHEKINGKGYPQGIYGKNIPMGARVLAVADSYDAMTSNRSYRNAMSMSAAVRELQSCSGSQFDPEVVQAFIEVLKKDYNYETQEETSECLSFTH